MRQTGDIQNTAACFSYLKTLWFLKNTTRQDRSSLGLGPPVGQSFGNFFVFGLGWWSPFFCVMPMLMPMLGWCHAILGWCSAEQLLSWSMVPRRWAIVVKFFFGT
jgi:hypothetical protein